MSLIRKFVDRIRAKRTAPPVIQTQWGPVTEGARHQAAMNMRYDGVLRMKVEELIINEYGGDVEAGLAECKRRYPEAYL